MVPPQTKVERLLCQPSYAILLVVFQMRTTRYLHLFRELLHRDDHDDDDDVDVIPILGSLLAP